MVFDLLGLWNKPKENLAQVITVWEHAHLCSSCICPQWIALGTHKNAPDHMKSLVPSRPSVSISLFFFSFVSTPWWSATDMNDSKPMKTIILELFAIFLIMWTSVRKSHFKVENRKCELKQVKYKVFMMPNQLI